MKKSQHIPILLLLILFQPLLLSCTSENKSKPNVILLVVDDLGWKDVGFMGSRFYETPNIDKLAKEGMIFTNAYAACAVCSPTRASIQTGRYPARIGVTDWIRARFQVKDSDYAPPPAYDENENRLLRTPSNPFWMEQEEVTIAEVLKQEGYFTCQIGKWHLGPDDYYPEKQGYDINIAGCDMGQPVDYFDPYANEKGVDFPTLEPRKEGEYLVDRLADELVNVIKNNRDQPFYINMNYYAVHTPIMAKPELIEKYEAKDVVDDQNDPVYAAMVENVDHAVGELIQVLEKEKVLDNTLIIFSSDNGGLIPKTSNKPLRSGKGYPYEGGIRVPMFVYWNGKIQAGTSADLPVSSIDLLPTICSLTKTPLPDKPIDGRDLSPIFNKEEVAGTPLFWHFPHYRHRDIVPYSIIRDGDWKLIKRYEGKEFELFNLKEDIGETNEVSSHYPDKVNELDNKLVLWLKDTNASLPLRKNPQAEITNGILKAKLYLPDGETGYYRAVRFDWSGLIYSLTYKDHNYFGEWNANYAPTKNAAVTGPAEEFDPLNYDQIKSGENFVKIGVGVLTKTADTVYDKHVFYPLVDPGKWEIKKNSDHIQFIHVLNGENYSYKYTKTVKLVEGKPQLLIAHTLENTGKQTIETNVLNHNFFVIDNQTTGTDFELTFPVDVAGSGKGMPEMFDFQGNKLLFIKDLAENESVFCESVEGTNTSFTEYDIKIYNTKVGAGTRIRGDRPVSRMHFWANYTTICPEPYVDIKVEAGAEFKWSYFYDFFIDEANAN